VGLDALAVKDFSQAYGTKLYAYGMELNACGAEPYR
jgi:hypothetical protein